MIPRFNEWLKGIVNRVHFSHGRITGDTGKQLLRDVSGDIVAPLRTTTPTWQDMCRRCATLPEPICQIFLPRPVKEDLMFTAREDECKVLVELAHASSISSVGPVAITGPTGCGRTSLIRWLSRQSDLSDRLSSLQFSSRVRSEDDLIRTISIQILSGSPCPTVEDLIDSLLKRPGGLILVDDFERLIFRAIGSGKVMRAFLTVMMCTQGHFLWIVSLADQAWKRLDYQYGFGGYFSTLIQLGYFSQEEMRTAIALRLRLGSVSLISAGEKGVGQFSEGQTSSRKSQDDEAAVPDSLAADLFENSGGNMNAALILLLLHSRYDPLGNTLEMQPIKPMDSSLPDNLGTLDRLTLAETLVHGGLTIMEHSEVFQIDPADSRLILERLYRQGLLDKQVGPDPLCGGAYRIHPLLVRLVSTALSGAHILY